MTSITDNFYQGILLLISGCILTTILFLIIRPSLQHRLRQYIDNHIKEIIAQQIELHQKSCATKQTNVQHSLYYSKPISKTQSKEMLYSFMMTYYPCFLRALADCVTTPLTSAEENTCILLKLGLCNKKIAESQRVSVNSVFKTRYRIKQKLNIGSEDDDLVRFIQQLGERLNKLPPGYIIYTEEKVNEKAAEKPND